MEMIYNQERWLCTIDVENTQPCFSKCLQLILWLEGVAEYGDMSKDAVFEQFVPFYISRATSEGINKQHILVNHERLIEAAESRRYKKITDSNMLLTGLNKEKNKKHVFYYYLRVHLNENQSDITEMQYLVLMLQTVPAICDRVAVRFMETSGSKWRTQDYFRVSHFFRFVQQKYGCFYACYDEAISSLKPLTNITQGVQGTFLPLLEVNGQLCQALNKTWILSSKYQKQNYANLYTALEPLGAKPNSTTWLLFQIGLRMFFKNLSGKKYSSASSKRVLLESLCQLTNEMQGITALDMILFGALVCDMHGGIFDCKAAKKLLEKIQMLSLSISQILENIVNHSERNQGVFTFRVQGNLEYLNIHYPDYSVGPRHSCLEILIADSNRRDGVVQHFVNSNKADTVIKDLANNVCLAHLFGDCRDRKMKEAWRIARHNRPEMCHGLISFANGVRTLNGAIRVRSAPDFESSDFRNVYYYNGTDKTYNNDFLLGEYIPGTQFSIVVNHLSIDNDAADQTSDEDWAFSFDKLVYATTYRELAQALAFEQEVLDLDISVIINENFSYPIDQAEKDIATTQWKEWFNSKLMRNQKGSRLVYKCNLDLLCQKLEQNPELGEPFCKGFLSSRFFVASDSGKYLCVLMQNPSARFSRIFKATLDVVASLELLETMNVSVYFYPQMKGCVSYRASTLHDLLGIDLNEEVFPRVFPYTLFVKGETGHTMFEEELLKQANTDIFSKASQGFKISKTHMRLGNKVHIDTFYEMALFFENPNYAYYTAYLFLRDLMQTDNELLKTKHKMIVYGYASYSRAIVWAILQILKQYEILLEIERFPLMEFVIYQNDLQLESDEAQIQMYYSVVEWQRNHEMIWDPQDTALIMVVPISSSMTTFNKMLAELCRETKKDFSSAGNYTAFWVRNNTTDEHKPTKEESFFWTNADPTTKTITSSIVQGEIRYLVSVKSEWSNPLNCRKCFPEDPIFEYPLVETDPTSTVPTQQFYRQQDQHPCKPVQDTILEKQNDERMARLHNNIVYGHVSHGSNHYQYYIKTREYFQQERDKVALWLQELRKHDIEQENPCVTSSNCINVLIIPQQANNVEFGQFVYEHYFHGCAESIIVNTEKEFRSNLKAEYSGLFTRLGTHLKTTYGVRFHYVDISVNSGSSFNRVVSLITSCMEEYVGDLENSKENQGYQFEIDQVFLLISRLSEASKRMYVRHPSKKFHAYVEVHISSMRTFGDSCVPCKLQQEAKRYYKKAATKSISAYWDQKNYDRACVSFDKVQNSIQNNLDLQEEGYQRMMCSHRAAHFIRPIQGTDIPTYFSAVRKFLNEILRVNSAKQTNQVTIYQNINDQNRKDWLSAGLKIIARPFFSFDYKMRCVVMDLYLILGEYMIKKCSKINLKRRLEQSREKKYILQDGNLDWIIEFADGLMSTIGEIKYNQLEFIRNNILKGLADIKSNYILRKDTILRITNQVYEACQLDDFNDKSEEFYEHYLRSILRLTHSSSDETKGVWLEYLLQYGDEYRQDIPTNGKNAGIDKLVSSVPNDIQNVFRNFLEILLVENNRPIYQAVVEFDKRYEQYQKSSETSEDSEKEVMQLLSEYHMRNAASFLSYQGSDDSIGLQLLALQQLLLQLKKKSPTLTCYKQLGEKIQAIVKAKAGNVADVILFGHYSENKPLVAEYLKLPNYFSLFPERFEDETDREKSPEKIIFEQHWGRIESDANARSLLNKHGFYLLSTVSGEQQFDVIIKLDNNYDDLKNSQESKHQKIEPIYIYIPCNLCRQQALGLTRMILMFRRKLIEWLENDFNNNAIAVLSEQKHLAKLLSTDKMGDHAEDDFVECQQKVLMAVTENEFENERLANCWEFAVTNEGERENLYELNELESKLASSPPLCHSLADAREWFLLRSYVNSRISRLFRTMARTGNTPSEEIIDAEIYYARAFQSVMMSPVRNLQTVFFTPTSIGFIRKNYLRLMMKTVTFTVQGKHDYLSNPKADINERLDNFSNQLKGFCCINLYSNENGKIYAYLAEYLATILLDCFVSGLKAGQVWNQSTWGGEAFQELLDKDACDKCEIIIDREHGGICGKYAFDYLVIQNAIFHPLRSEKKGPGMSQAAIRWYIEGLWRSCLPNENSYPVVQPILGESNYVIKLPILEPHETC